MFRNIKGQNVEGDAEDAIVEFVVKDTLVELVANILLELAEEILVELFANILLELAEEILVELVANILEALAEEVLVELVVKDAPALNNARKVVSQRVRKEDVRPHSPTRNSRQ